MILQQTVVGCSCCDLSLPSLEKNTFQKERSRDYALSQERVEFICKKADVYKGDTFISSNRPGSISGQLSQYGEHSQSSQGYNEPYPKTKVEVRSVEIVSKSTRFLSLFRQLRWKQLHCPCAWDGDVAHPQFQSHPHLLNLSALFVIGLITNFP